MVKITIIFFILITFNVYAVSSVQQDTYIKSAIKQIELGKKKYSTGEQRDFIRDYTYRASDEDSKISSRNKASAALKSILLSEIGVHITSSLEIKTQASLDNRVSTQIDEIITSYTAGAVSMVIIEEKWNGETFYIKGRIRIDPKSVAEGISEGLKAEADSKTITQLQLLLDEKTQSMDVSSNKLQSIESELSRNLLISKTKENELARVKKQLVKMKMEITRFEESEKQVLNEIDRIRKIINSATISATTKLVTGMTKYEVVSAIGKPRSTAKCGDSYFQNYGVAWLWYESNILQGWVSINDWRGKCGSPYYKSTAQRYRS